MAQVFHPSMNTVSRVSVLCGLIFPVALIGVASAITRSSYGTKAKVPVDQPVPFSHEHHVNELGIDCRYCHTNVEKSANAGVPPVHTCMSCHSQIWTNSPLLEPIRDSYATNTPIRNAYGETGWNRLNKVPEFVYFNHSIHVNRGINCNYCHGPVQTMQLMYKGKPFFMAWCLNCHRHPENYVRDNTQEFTLYRKLQRGEELTPEEAALAEGGDYQRTPAELEEGRRLLAKYHVNKAQLTDCWVCHR
ncbi:MAG TPA: cytochrome c3 family protein [Chthonomonadaceae bacterium]|nr:cytochrome c3 family protein [Chthonomonadaceae bacterium]